MERGREQHYYAKAPIPFGSRRNKGYISALRLNYSTIDKAMEEQLGQFGAQHDDQWDHAQGFTMLVNASNIGGDDYMGI